MNTTPMSDQAHYADSRVMFGFWTYLMTDCVLFASLFATYAVLRGNNFGGPGSAIFDLSFVLTETLVLLMSSVICGLAVLSARTGVSKRTVVLLSATWLLGVLFVGLELSEFVSLAAHGTSWQTSAFLSSYFTLVGTHGLHVFVGLIWMLLLIVRVAKQGLTRGNTRKLILLSMFWHFLDIIWIFIFSIVYLLGAV